MPTIFSKIISGEVPAYKIAETKDFIAFLDAMPLVEGHTLVIPKKETDLIFDLSEEDFKNLWAFAREVAKKIGAAIPCRRVGIAVIGLEVPHAHIHLVPLQSVEEINFTNPRKAFSPAEYLATQQAIINSK